MPLFSKCLFSFVFYIVVEKKTKLPSSLWGSRTRVLGNFFKMCLRFIYQASLQPFSYSVHRFRTTVYENYINIYAFHNSLIFVVLTYILLKYFFRMFELCLCVCVVCVYGSFCLVCVSVCVRVSCVCVFCVCPVLNWQLWIM